MDGSLECNILYRDSWVATFFLVIEQGYVTDRYAHMGSCLIAGTFSTVENWDLRCKTQEIPVIAYQRMLMEYGSSSCYF